jgi:hypothetical protein
MNCDNLEQLLAQKIFDFVIIIELETPQHNITTLYGIQALWKNILKDSQSYMLHTVACKLYQA